MFRITDKKGFQITFENGYTVSVQFGPCNYCSNYNAALENTEKVAAKGSMTAECAVWAKDGCIIAHFNGDSVSNRSTPAEVLKLLNWAAKQKVG